MATHPADRQHRPLLPCAGDRLGPPVYRNAAQRVTCEQPSEGFHDVETETVGPAFEFLGGSEGWPVRLHGVTYVPPGAVVSAVSQADADSQALALAQAGHSCQQAAVLPARTFWPVDVFGGDDCEMYPVGALGSLYGGYSWVAAVVPFTPIDYTMGFDSSESYSIGALPSATGGTGWPASGTFFTPS